MNRLRLRQVALVAADLERAEHDIADELGLSLCFRDPGVATFGLRNALFPVGEHLLEVVSPTSDGTAAGRYLQRRGGDGGYMVLVQTDEDVDRLRARLEGADMRIVFQAEAPGITGLHLHPRDVGGAILSVDRTDRWDEWPWAGPTWRDHIRTDRVTGLRRVDIAATDPVAMCERWAAVLGRPAPLGRTDIPLDDDTSLRFVTATARGEGVDAIELVAAPGRPTTDHVVAGCTVRIR